MEEETEEMQEFVEQEMVVSDLIKELSGKETVFRGSVCKGCGIQLGLKIALQLISNPVLVFSDDHISPIRAFLNLPSIKCSNPAPAAAAIARALNCSVLCYIDNKNTAENLQSIVSAGRENIIYISYNTGVKKMFSELFPSYSASASVSHLDDYISKLKRAIPLQGLRFIELFSPCPESGFDPSNTIEVARLAVETGTWPLYEIDKGRFSLTYKPTRLEPLVSYLEAIGASKTQEEINELQERVRKKWKRLSKK
jgi:hypothetical protein